MRQLARLYGFWYGCLGALFAFSWQMSAILGHFAFPDNWWIVEVIFVFHGCAAVLTFQPLVRPPWQPVLAVTPRRIWLAKLLLGLATLSFVLCFGTFLIARFQGNQRLEDKTIPLVLTSFLLQNTVYIAIHWAFRPDKLFSASFIRLVSNPIGFLFLGKPKE